MQAKRTEKGEQMEGKKTLTVTRCGARTTNGICEQLPINGTGRCRLHGGLSTGSKTPEGRKRQSEAQIVRWGILRAALNAYEATEGAQ